MSEKGSAVAEFVFVSTLLLLLCGALFQLAFALHLRNTIIDAAGEGARLGALNNSSVQAGINHTQYLLERSIPGKYSTSVTGSLTELNDLEILQIEVTSTLPLLGVLGPQVIHSVGRANVE